MTAAGSSFERRARRLRRALRRHPALQRLADLGGVPLWRWYLRNRLGAGAALPEGVEIDPATIGLALPRRAVERRPAAGGPGAVRGGSWDRRAVPLARAEGPGAAPACEPPGELVVAFDRRGRPCLVDDAAAGGQAMALPAGPRPARVALRHRRWARLAIEARAYTRQRGGTAYQPYLHPDLADLPSDQGHERFDLLLGALPVRSGTLVDLGANSGYFSHRFEAAGFDCVAVERSQKEAHFLAALRDAAGRRFAVLRGSLTEVALPERPDVVLALNVFHHFLKTEAGFRELAGFLDRLHARFLLFEAHLPDDPQMAQAPHNMPPGEFVEWVRRAGGFATAREIGRAADRRPLYLLAAEG